MHEHWNNNTSRQYSRNLNPSTGTGIELLSLEVGNPGDVNLDKSVNVIDLLTLASSFGLNRGQPGFDQRADQNFSGRVDVVDLLVLADNWGKTYP